VSSSGRGQIRLDDEPLLERLRELAAKRRRFGYRRLGVLLRRKRVFRIYRAANLQVRKRAKRRVAFGRGEPAIKTTAVNERWSLDFVHDSLHNGRRIRALTVVEDFSRETLAIEVDTSISGTRMTAVLDRIADERGYPKTIVMDNGTEMTSLAMLAWAASHRVRLHYIAPGKPTKNAFIESFYGRFRDECLNEHVFLNLSEDRGMARGLQRSSTAQVPRSPHPQRVRPARIPGCLASSTLLIGYQSGATSLQAPVAFRRMTARLVKNTFTSPEKAAP
jgi:putative transposase